jgi:cardiolipin synthase
VTLAWLPNAITLARMALAAPLAWLILAERWQDALVVAVAAGLSDALDGLLAKRCGWQSRLGGLLDPIADKLVLSAGFVGLTVVGAVPPWLLALVIGRDLVIVAGAAAYHTLVAPLEARPSRLSKATTALQITLVPVLLVDRVAGSALPAGALAALLWATAAATLASGIHYVVAWSLKTRRELAARRPRT